VTAAPTGPNKARPPVSDPYRPSKPPSSGQFDSGKKSKMRLIAFIAAALVASTPAFAQSWKEYAYPDYAFTVSFPAEPKIETKPYEIPDGRSVEAQVFSVARDGGIFTMTVADLGDAAVDENAVLDNAIKTLSQGGEIKVNIRHRIGRVFGRQVSVAGADGSHATAAVFYYKQRLYQIEGKSLPSGNDATAQAIRFQQSLIFTGDDGGRRGAGGRQRPQRPLQP